MRNKSTKKNSYIKHLLVLSLLGLTTGLFPNYSSAVPELELAPEDQFNESLSSDPLSDDSNDDFETLINDAQRLLFSGRPIDARAKLQRALKLSPRDYRPHMMLGQYYLFEVSHFKLAYRYLRNAEKLFEDSFGNEKQGTLKSDQTAAHLTLIYLLSEAQLNLDKYDSSLQSLNRIENHPWVKQNGLPDWYPGTKAWVLMKLKKVDEAIEVARTGLFVQRADPRRTWNILGILLSVRENREQSLYAFGEAIKSELSLYGMGQVATPLNNAGEVYRELFQDELAESSWQRAVRLPDGCEHILPSLNLSILLVDQLRLFQAERSLSDFEACFAQQQVRKDTEHRTLLALSRGRIALHANDLEKGLNLLKVAEQEQQWFGKIGTNENDVEFASAIAMAQGLNAQAESLRDTVRDKSWKQVKDGFYLRWLKVRSWWLNRKARRIGLEELDDLEDLFIRNTDTMLEYPTLGTALAGFKTSSLEKRLSRMKVQDSRTDADTYYDLYLGTNYLAHGDTKNAEAFLGQALQNFREIDRLARAETLSKLITAKNSNRSWWKPLTESDEKAIMEMSQEVFSLLPSHLRFHGLALPVKLQLEPSDRSSESLLLRIAHELTSVRFSRAEGSLKAAARYSLMISDQPARTSDRRTVTIHLVDSLTNSQITSHTAEVPLNGSELEQLINNFIKLAFAHRADPPAQPLKPIPILEGIIKQ